MEFIARAKEKFRVGLAHSDCDYDTAVRAFRNGASHVIHLFNGMSSLSHREPGLPGAVFDSDCLPTAEIIGDGLHVHPAVIRMAAKLLGKDRLVLISDAIVAAGLPDGRYVSGDMPIIVKDGQARIEAGNLAGSSITVMEGLRRALRFGVDRETALRAVTINPARVLGVDKDLGTIEVGKLADFTVVNSQLEVQRVMIGGKPFNRGLT